MYCTYDWPVMTKTRQPNQTFPEYQMYTNYRLHQQKS